MQWFTLQVRTAHEKKIKKYLEKRKKEGFSDLIGEIYIPEHNKTLVMPGYIFIQSKIWPDKLFAGTSIRCITIGRAFEHEIKEIKSRYQRPIIKLIPKKGDRITLTDGPFAGAIGIVEAPGSKHSRINIFNGEMRFYVDNAIIRIFKEGA
jgi:transcription antitermination factor NusG